MVFHLAGHIEGPAGSVAQWVGGRSFTDAVREEADAILQRRSVALVALRHKLLSSARGEAIEGSVCVSNVPCPMKNHQ